MQDETSPELMAELWNPAVSWDTYGSKEQYYEHIFEQYKMFVEMADRISTRRNTANAFFLSLHTLIVTVVTFAYDKGLKLNPEWLVVFPLIAVLLLCWVWWRLIHSYRQLNRAKYKVIGEYEQRLPSSPYWKAEWTALGRGENRKLYWPLTDAENLIPLTFGVLYLFAAGILLWP